MYAGMLVLIFFGFKTVPVGFIPMQDQGYLIGLAQLPDGATLERSDEMREQMVRLASSVPGVSHKVEFAGFSGLDGTNRSNAVTTFLVLAQSNLEDSILAAVSTASAAKVAVVFADDNGAANNNLVNSLAAKKRPEENGFAILAEVQRPFATLQEGRAMCFPRRRSRASETPAA